MKNILSSFSKSGLYQSAQEQNWEGVHIVSTDEMTGIQALKHKYPHKLPLPDQCYPPWHGFIGFFDAATGRMEMTYLNPTRTEEDFVEAVKALVEQTRKPHGHLYAMT